MFVSSCDTRINIPKNDQLWECVNKYSKDTILFLKSKSFEYKPVGYPVSIIVIDDVRGKRWSINEFEKESYTCADITTKYKESSK